MANRIFSLISGLGRFMRAVGRGLRLGIVRIYALGVLLLVAWAGYVAVAYLVRSVFILEPVPRRLLEWEGTLDAAALRKPNIPGQTAVAARAPISHFHRLERWFQSDPGNGCTTAGCHEPLPHTRQAKVPAFANLHATFLACTMCHGGGDHDMVSWISTSDGRDIESPALLRLIRFVERGVEELRKDAAGSHATIVSLLSEAVAASGNDPALAGILLEFQTTEANSPVWRRAIERLMRELPLHVRGEYGAKLAHSAKPGAYRDSMRLLLEQARDYHDAHADPARRKQFHTEIHGGLLKEPAACISCHTAGPGRLDYEKLGYTARRARLLSNLQLASLMQRIRQGEKFFIPQLMERGDAKK